MAGAHRIGYGYGYGTTSVGGRRDRVCKICVRCNVMIHDRRKLRVASRLCDLRSMNEKRWEGKRRRSALMILSIVSSQVLCITDEVRSEEEKGNFNIVKNQIDEESDTNVNKDPAVGTRDGNTLSLKKQLDDLSIKEEKLLSSLQSTAGISNETKDTLDPTNSMQERIQSPSIPQAALQSVAPSEEKPKPKSRFKELEQVSLNTFLHRTIQ